MAKTAAPPWADQSDIDEYGAAFLCCFADAAHWCHFKATGSLVRPASARATARRRSDPVKAQRERLQRRCSLARCGIADARQKIAKAEQELASGKWALWDFEIKARLDAQRQRLTERTAALQRAQTELELFRLIHADERRD